MHLHLVFKIWDFLGYGKPDIKKGPPGGGPVVQLRAGV
jgi:hypothetical protein